MVVRNLNISNLPTRYLPCAPEGSLILSSGSFLLISVSRPKEFRSLINTGITKRVA
jgi:hypothetical protein